MSFSLFNRLESHLLNDDVLGQAYESVSAEQRALLKTAIARLWEWYGPSRIASCSRELEMRGGFHARETRKPVDFAMIVCGEDSAAPSQVLAAVVPAVAAGVEDVIAIKVGRDGWTKAQLTALELAGIEAIAELGVDEAAALIKDVHSSVDTGSLILLDTPENLAVTAQSSTIRTLVVRDATAVAFHDPSSAAPDLERLAFGQAGVPVTVFGETPVIDFSGFSCENKSLDVLMKADARVAFVPDEYHSQALERFRVVFGPGHEACWLWSEITTDMFEDSRVSWATGEQV